MGRIFDAKQENAPATTTRKGRLFKEPVAKPKSATRRAGEFLVPTITKTIDKAKKGEDITTRDIVGSGFEAASYFIPGTAIAKGVGLVAKAGTLASKIAIPAAVGGVSGASFGAGQAVAEGEDFGGIIKEALKTGAIGTVAGGAIGAGLSKLAQRKAAQEAAKRLPEAVPETPVVEKVGLYKVADDYKTRKEFVDAQVKAETKVKPRTLPTSELAKRASKTPLNEFIKTETNSLVAQRKKVPEAYYEKLTNIWNKANKEPTYIVPGKKRVKELEEIWNVSKRTPSATKVIPDDVPAVETATKQSQVTKVAPEEYVKYEKALEEDPIFVKGSVTNKNIIDNYAEITKTVPTDELMDMMYGVNGKKLPNNLPPSAVYNLLEADFKKLTTAQAQRLLNTQPLSKAGFDLQAAKIKSGEIITNPLQLAKRVEALLKEKALSLKISKSSIKKFIDDNTCTLS